MNARTGKLSNRDLDTLNRAWELLSKWTEVHEDEVYDGDGDSQIETLYNDAMNAVCGLCDFISEYED